MPPKYAPKKLIPVSPFGLVDVSEYLPIIDAPEFQRLKYCTQLGLVREVFPNATHTRHSHSLGVLHMTHRFAKRLCERGFFDDVDRDQLLRDLGVAALVHDIAHPPYSHAVEYVIAHMADVRNPQCHRERAVGLIRDNLAERIEQVGSDPERVVALLDKKQGDPVGSIITNKNVGADKVAYLEQDQYMTGHIASRPTDMRVMHHYLCFVDNQLCMEEKGAGFLKSLQDFYFCMWTNVYLRKASLAFERMLQKSLEWFIDEEDVDPDGIWGKPEGWVETRLSDCPHVGVRLLYERIKDRRGLKTAVSIKLSEYEAAERKASKPITTMTIEKEQMHAILDYYENPLHLTRLEDRLESAVLVSPVDLVVAIAPEPGKLVPEDIPLVTSSGMPAGTLYTRFPKFHTSIQESADEFFAIRVMVPEEYRKRVSMESEVIMKIIAEDSGVEL